MVHKRKKHKFRRFVIGFILLGVGAALIIANIPLGSAGRLNLAEGIILVVIGGYLLGTLVWEGDS